MFTFCLLCFLMHLLVSECFIFFRTAKGQSKNRMFFFSFIHFASVHVAIETYILQKKFKICLGDANFYDSVKI